MTTINNTPYSLLPSLYPTEGSLLAHYQPHFECVYVMLHPFLKCVNLSAQPQASLIAQRETKDQFRDSYPPIAWQQIVQQCELVDSIAQLDIALRTMNLSLPVEYEDIACADALSLWLDEQLMFPPEESVLSWHIDQHLYTALNTLGIRWLHVGDADNTMPQQLIRLSELNSSDELPLAEGYLYSPDKALLIATPPGQFCSYLCGSQQLIEKILNVQPIEGFYCDAQTNICWSISPLA